MFNFQGEKLTGKKLMSDFLGQKLTGKKSIINFSAEKLTVTVSEAKILTLPRSSQARSSCPLYFDPWQGLDHTRTLQTMTGQIRPMILQPA